MDREKVYRAIDSERNFQDRKWGSVDQHPHEVGGWLTIMRKLLSDAEQAWSSSGGDYQALFEIRKIIAVGVACCEQHGVSCRSPHEARGTLAKASHEFNPQNVKQDKPPVEVAGPLRV
jgi:hypothetical protein